MKEHVDLKTHLTPSARSQGGLFNRILLQHGLSLERKQLKTVQVNLGKLCNQTCIHCHVDAGPHRTRQNMDSETAERVLYLIENTPGLTTVDLTGGAPELNPNFRRLVKACRALGLEVIDRCNLTVIFEPGQHDLVEFLAEHKVRIVASLPCYTSDNVESQRGNGVFKKSIEALQKLNAAGYGKATDHVLDLVYNPNGAFLPPPQDVLEADYKSRLRADFGIEFNRLFALTNLPVKRFCSFLKKKGETESYQKLLVDHFNPAAAQEVMCRSLISISWDGKLFDCDFNQMENLPVSGSTTDIWSLESLETFSELGSTRPPSIQTANHCFGCTAGQGSSCGGAVAKKFREVD